MSGWVLARSLSPGARQRDPGANAAAGMTSGSVRNVGGAVTGVVGVAGNTPFAANPGYTYAIPSTGVVNQSVTVLPAVNLLSM